MVVSQLEEYDMDLQKSLAISMAIDGLTQQELARKIGVTQAQISSISVRGTCTTGTLDKLSKAFGIKVSVFIARGE